MPRFDGTEGELNISRISRLLRPLRNKCTTLASTESSSSRPTAFITYGTRRSTWKPDDAPPLAVIQHPAWLVSRAHLDRQSRMNLPLSGHIYATVDAFKNVVLAAFGSEGSDVSPNVLDLTDMCASLVGRTIREEVAANIEPREEDEEDQDEDGERAIIDELYECVPLRFRRWTLLSHAVSIVLDTSPHHPTLLIRMLELTLSYRLVPESTTILRALLIAAIRPSRTSSLSLIAHPAHPAFLIDLCTKWTSAGGPEGAAAFSARAFISLTVGVLVEYGTSAAWTCRAVRRLAWPLRKRDMTLYLLVLDGLSRVAAAGVRVDAMTIAENDLLLERLTKWMRTISADFPSDTDMDEETLCAVVESLNLARSLGLHQYLLETELDSPPLQVQGALVCLATQCLASPLFSTCRPTITAELLGLLTSVQPATATFRDIASPLFTPPEPLSFSPVKPQTPSHSSVLRALRSYSESLRRHAFWALDASLWSCALREFERADRSTSSADRRAAAEFRSTLMDAVGDAENRLFANRPRVVDMEETGVWDWEDMVGCWVKKSPPSKKPRIESQVQMRSSTTAVRRLPSRLSPAVSTSSSSSKPSSSTTVSSQSSVRSRSESPVTEPEASEFEEEVADTPLTTRGSCRPSSIKSILADSQHTRTDLRAERRASGCQTAPRIHSNEEEESPGNRRLSELRSILSNAQKQTTNLREERRASSRLRRDGDEDEDDDRGDDNQDTRGGIPKKSGKEMPSDDLLDLFAYEDTF